MAMRISTMKDDPEFNIKFVALVRQFPCLYDNTSLNYASKSLQLQAWETIANEFDETVMDCKDRWKNLRGCYTRHLKNQTEELAGLRHRKPYYLAHHLNFLLPFTKTRPQIMGEQQYVLVSNNDDTADGLEGHEGDLGAEEEVEEKYVQPQIDYDIPSTSGCSKKPEKRDALLDDLKSLNSVKKFRIDPEATSEDSDLLFFKSLLPDIKEMNSRQKLRLKIGILELCDRVVNDDPEKEVTSTQSGPKK